MFLYVIVIKMTNSYIQAEEVLCSGIRIRYFLSIQTHKLSQSLKEKATLQLAVFFQ